MRGLVCGRYRITEKLGEGGMAQVYTAVHDLISREAAVKVLNPEMSAQQVIVKRFLQEAQAAASIKHPGIVEIYDVGYADDGRAYIVMEKLIGETLNARLGKQPRLSVESTKLLMRQLGGVMGAAHDMGIVHRDLKPDNIFVVPDPEVEGGERIKVLDFGLAKLLSNCGGSLITTQGSIFGTPSYMAPEQCQDSRNVDHRADLYSIGCIFYRCLCGQPPFGGDALAILSAHISTIPEPPRRRRHDIPAYLDSLILRLLEKHPARRPSSAAEFIAALDGGDTGAAGNVTLVDVGNAVPAARADTSDSGEITLMDLDKPGGPGPGRPMAPPDTPMIPLPGAPVSAPAGRLATGSDADARTSARPGVGIADGPLAATIRAGGPPVANVADGPLAATIRAGGPPVANIADSSLAVTTRRADHAAARRPRMATHQPVPQKRGRKWLPWVALVLLLVGVGLGVLVVHYKNRAKKRRDADTRARIEKSNHEALMNAFDTHMAEARGHIERRDWARALGELENARLLEVTDKARLEVAGKLEQQALVGKEHEETLSELRAAIADGNIKGVIASNARLPDTSVYRPDADRAVEEARDRLVELASALALEFAEAGRCEAVEAWLVRVEPVLPGLRDSAQKATDVCAKAPKAPKANRPTMSPEEMARHVEVAKDAYGKQEYQAAYDSCNKVLKVKRSHRDAGMWCGMAACRLKKAKKALRLYKRLPADKARPVQLTCLREGIELNPAQ